MNQEKVTVRRLEGGSRYPRSAPTKNSSPTTGCRAPRSEEAGCTYSDRYLLASPPEWSPSAGSPASSMAATSTTSSSRNDFKKKNLFPHSLDTWHKLPINAKAITPNPNPTNFSISSTNRRITMISSYSIFFFKQAEIWEFHDLFLLLISTPSTLICSRRCMFSIISFLAKNRWITLTSISSCS